MPLLNRLFHVECVGCVTRAAITCVSSSLRLCITIILSLSIGVPHVVYGFKQKTHGMGNCDVCVCVYMCMCACVCMSLLDNEVKKES